MIQRFLILGAAIMMAGAVHAQSISSTELAERLNISESTAAAVVDVLDGIEREPGFLWTAAAELADRLTPEQRAELLDAMPSARGAERRQRMRGQTDRGEAASQHRMPMQRVLRELEGLTDEQRVQLRQLHQQYGAQVRDLAQQHRDPEVDRDQLRQQRAQLQRQIVSEVRTILTPEQQERAQELIQNLQQRRGGERTERTSEDRRSALARHRGERRADKARGRRGAEQQRETLSQQHSAREAALELTEEQKAAITEAREAQRARIAERRTEGAERRQRGALRHDREMGHMRQLRPGHGMMSEILTQEQQTVVQLRAALARAFASRGR
jgi:hypothetical protein